MDAPCRIALFRFRVVGPFLLALAAMLAGVATARARADEQLVLFGFDDPDAAQAWRRQGPLEMRVAAAPEAAARDESGPIGTALRVSASASSGIYSTPSPAAPDWDVWDEVSFWVYRSEHEAEGEAGTVIEVLWVERGGQARFWRKGALTHRGWKQIRLPLRWFRWGTGRVPQWDRIEALGFRFRDRTSLWLDKIALLDGHPDRGSEMTADDLREAAFPGAEPGQVRSVASAELTLLTNAPGLDLGVLAPHLRAVSERLFRDLPFLEKPRTPPCLVVFASRSEYQAFHQRFAELLGAVAEAPQSGGYTVHGVATSFWDEKIGTLRPVYTHEFVHAVLSKAALVDNKGDWLQEGLASHYQLAFHPQENIGGIIQERIADTKKHLPLRTLCNGSRIPANRYWQAATVVEMLMRTDRYREHLPKLFEEFRRTGSTDLSPHVATVLRTSWDEIEEGWRKFCQMQPTCP